jgi:cell wall-associated NlpC family hydrolase
VERRKKWIIALGVGGMASIAGFVLLVILIVLLVTSPFIALQKNHNGNAKLVNTAGIPAELVPLITSAANNAGCPEVTPSVLAAQLAQESGFNAVAHSGVGAMGIAQFMPATWVTWGGGGNVWDPRDAIPAAARYDCAVASAVASVASADPRATMLAAYNAGPGAVLAYAGIPPFTETQNYVRTILAQALVYGDDLSGGTVVSTATIAPVVAFMRAQVGKPYVWGAVGPNAWDCSSLIQAAYATVGVHLHRTTFDQVGDGEQVSGTDPQPGDLLFIPGSDGSVARPGHVGMYIGGGQVIDAKGARWGVVVSPLSDWTDVVDVVRPLAGK